MDVDFFDAALDRMGQVNHAVWTVENGAITAVSTTAHGESGSTHLIWLGAASWRLRVELRGEARRGHQ